LGEIESAGLAKNKFPSKMKLRFGSKWENSFSNLFDREGEIDKTGKPTSVIAVLDGDVAFTGTVQSPWRYVKLTTAKDGMLESLKR
jgi:hypothetical protein